jgi:glycosyltransferase involved in cell wall biosynthesis
VKIALVVPGGVDRSGLHRVIPCLLWQIERLAAAGDEVHVFALGQEPCSSRWPLLGAEVHNIGPRPRPLRAVAQLAAEHRRGRFDIVHAYWAAGPGVAAAAFSLWSGVPSVLTLPGGDLVALKDIGYGAQLSLQGRIQTRFALAGAQRVIVQSGWAAAKAAAFGVSAVQIPLGVAIDRWPISPPRPRQPGQPLRLVQVAHLNRVKDQNTLLRAARTLLDRGVDFHLDIIGLDTLGGAVQRRASELGLDGNIAFRGLLTHPEIRPWVEAADLLVVSSRHEAGPVVVLEAAVAGVPTVGTGVGHVADWSPAAAAAVPIGDSAALAGAIEALDRDEAARLQLARSAQDRAVAEDANDTVRRIRRLYGELIEARAPRPAPARLQRG